jgi:hypothetical protein
MRRIIRRFEQLGAISPNRAVSIDQLGESMGFIMRRLISQGVIAESGRGRYYLNPGKLEEFNALRRKKATIVLGIIILAVLMYALSGFLR